MPRQDHDLSGFSPPRSAYIHVPFCSHRCGYCNFTLIAGRDELTSDYLRALELDLTRTLKTPQRVDTIFLGGGTPTHLHEESLAQLLNIIAKWLKPSALCEFSCEANPLDCTPTKLAILQAGGVNRLSLGGQSFSNTKLQNLERDHSGEQLQETLDRCSQTFSNLSLDLIFAAPGETIEQWHQDVHIAISAPITHLSTYGLTIERGSAFYGRKLRQLLFELDSELQLAMYEHVIDAATAAGWQHYEVSNFSLPGQACRHNQAYWLGEPWWAFGPGAASFLPEVAEQTNVTEPPRMVRSVNHQSTTTYIRRSLAGESVVAERVSLSLEERVRERLVFGLRQRSGVQLSELDRLYGGHTASLFGPYLSQYVEHGFLAWEGDRLYLTRRGLMISDSLWPNLLQ